MKKETPTKKRILQTTRVLMSTHGCENTTIDDILTATGITKGAFYHYFKSKDALCESILTEVMDEYKNLLDPIETISKPIDKLKTLITKIIDLNTSGQWVNCKLIFKLGSECRNTHSAINTKLKQFWLWYTDTYKEILNDCRNSSQISTIQPLENQLYMLISFLTGIILNDNLDIEKPTTEHITETAMKLLK
jgi:TetR/AcrR family transcriptional regulator, transcriptional repressor for nem operon